jgi:hypothetical protein
MVNWWVLGSTVAHVSGYIKYKKLMILVFEDTVLHTINSCPYFFRELAVPQNSLILVFLDMEWVSLSFPRGTSVL